ncbi:hypothetical protein LB561_06765 [Mesorhizobium sp. B292B1B]|uniref:hypothetical protein n=1 Tax=unclassified Mesorhizobium TaxID=325217 RepID=UPI00112633DA|nr:MULTISPECIES: hypothetical protein [unclassified Mesorhizobium]MCA0011437.1 hypothetical protein [Mesorhizobium sp. B294B1A1]MCA0036991.1 hypothetical protein [Mesorhizobium sp. B292B1B]TPM46970.1 hypothetical protein FJ964_13865 [Mesorhizobium sp. B2-3-2]
MPRAGIIRQAEAISMVDIRAGVAIARRRRRVCESTSGPAAPDPNSRSWAAGEPRQSRSASVQKTFRDGHTLPGFAMLLQLSDYIALQT